MSHSEAIAPRAQESADLPLVVGGHVLASRLIVGTGKYATYEEMARCLEASGTDCVTVAVRRERLVNTAGENILDHLDASRYALLPNTAGCVTAEEAIRVARLGRELARLAGQEEMKLALLLNVIDPGIGGVLIMGDRGTGKSVAVSRGNRRSDIWKREEEGGGEG